MSDKRVLDDEDIATTWRRSGAKAGLQADPDTKDSDGTDGDGTDGTDGDSGDTDTTDS
jgi:hypothetical protein